MTFCVKNHREKVFLSVRSVYYTFFDTLYANFSRYDSTFCCKAPSESAPSVSSRIFYQEEQHIDSSTRSDLDVLVAKVQCGSSSDEILRSLLQDQVCSSIHVSHDLIIKLLHRFRDDWKSALGIFRWVESCPSYKPLPESYDMLVDILGKAKQLKRMKLMVEEMRQNHLVTLNTIAKVLRRLAGSGAYEDAIRTFDQLYSFGLEKNTESMNLILDTLCKENKVKRAREIFLELKSYIPPDAHTFNIFIHGWCKVKRVEEAQWTIQEMKGHGCRPCVISYSTIIQSYCFEGNFNKVYKLLDEMQAQGCTPNVVTYTTIMCALTKSEEFEEALHIVERMKSVGCKPDTLFYNALIYTLGRSGQVTEALQVVEMEMPKIGVTPTTSTYNSLIAMLCHYTEVEKALDVLSDMDSSPYCEPNIQSYHPLLKLCFKTGKTDGLLSTLLDDMINRHHISLDLSTYTLLIHGLCRANKCEWAYLLFKEMIGREIKPRYKTCRLLLDEIKQKNIYDAEESIEEFMKEM